MGCDRECDNQRTIGRNTDIMAENQQKKESELWSLIVKDMRNQGEVGEYGFDAYISKLSLRADTGTALLLEYPADMSLDWLEINYAEHITHSAARVLDAARSLQYVPAGSNIELPTTGKATVPATTDATTHSPKGGSGTRGTTRKPRTPLLNSGLNRDYRFDNFVVGSSNEFAYAAAYAVAHSDSCRYNPLFIHGGSGLGKTHLLHAIGNAICERDEKTQVLYVTSEDFTNAYIDALGKKGEAINAFRRKYRKADVLLIDDVQFLAHKDKTQEELFHTFNALFGSGKRIVLSADCPASEITLMDERLTSRFEQGLAVTLMPPCFETRVAILRNKRRDARADFISDEVIDFLARSITRSVRRLEGAFISLASYSSFSRRRITVVEARMLLKDKLHEERGSRISIEDIQRRVAEEFDIRVSDLNGRRRTANIAHPRQVAMYLARKHTEISLQDIGDAFGGRDHGTVIHATRMVEQKLAGDAELREQVQRLVATLA